MSDFVWGDPSTYPQDCVHCGVALPAIRIHYMADDRLGETCRTCHYESLVLRASEHAKQFRPWQSAYWRWRRNIREWRKP